MKVRSGLEREMTQLLKAKVTTKMKICRVVFGNLYSFFWGGVRWGRELGSLALFFSYLAYTFDILSIWFKKKKDGSGCTFSC